MLIGITSMPLLGVTQSDNTVKTSMKSPVTTLSTVQSCPPTVLPENTTCPLVVETAVSQPDDATDTGAVKISSKHPSGST